MKIKRLYINNYKSLVNFELVEPNPFSVFVGPNAAGKSNVFEAFEFLSYSSDFVRGNDIFGGANNYLNKNLQSTYKNIIGQQFEIDVKLDAEFLNTKDEIELRANIKYLQLEDGIIPASGTSRHHWADDYKEWIQQVEQKENTYINKFSRIFIKNSQLVKSQIKSSLKLSLDCSNLESVLYRILQDEIKRDEITEWMESLIPGLEKVEVAKSDLSGDYFLRIFEKHLPDPIGKNLISDGTYNILALLTAVYQSDEPQFLCIEEPENGLTPYVLRSLVNFFRTVCEEKGHYIWLNTHSPTIVNELQPKELILIDKIEGITKAKQLDPNLKLKTMKLDEAWLTNSLGGGLPW